MKMRILTRGYFKVFDIDCTKNRTRTLPVKYRIP